jgi:hypothetical protein
MQGNNSTTVDPIESSGGFLWWDEIVYPVIALAMLLAYQAKLTRDSNGEDFIATAKGAVREAQRYWQVWVRGGLLSRP